MRSIFIVDNEESILEITSKYLMRERFKVETFPQWKHYSLFTVRIPGYVYS